MKTPPDTRSLAVQAPAFDLLAETRELPTLTRAELDTCSALGGDIMLVDAMQKLASLLKDVPPEHRVALKIAYGAGYLAAVAQARAGGWRIDGDPMIVH